MRIVFRVDASEQIGSGHVMRCLTLADALRQGNATCRFICREHQGHLASLIGERGYKVILLPSAGTVSADVDSASKLAHSSWLGVGWQTDIEQTLFALGDDRADWLVLDHYALDARWESAVRQVANRIMVLDDIADRQHDCDLLLDQNFGSSSTRYTSRVPRDCMQLHGPAYALLRPSYAAQRASLVRANDGIKRIFVYFGGCADVQDMTGLALQALCHESLAAIRIDVVLGAAYPYRPALEVLARRRGGVVLHATVPDLTALMANADLAIGAGGATTWERCCLGLPSVVVSVAENQRPACEALASEGLIKYLGHTGCVGSEAFIDTILQLKNNPSLLGRYSKVVAGLVDGRGVERVVAYLFRDNNPMPV